VTILLLSAGGGGGNILRSLKALFRRDVMIAEKTDAKYAERLRHAVTTRFLDTNEFSLLNVPAEERVLIGAATTRRFGSRHDPNVARAALDESREEVERLISRYSVVIIVGSGGKGTGAGTIFPLAHMVRKQRKLVIPIFVRPSFEHHEVEKRRYDHALRITDQFDAAKIRFIEILNERGYSRTDPQPQAIVWERMNRPIAGALRTFLYVLSDLSQVDPSDLSTLFAGEGRLRMGFAELDADPGCEPNDAQIEAAALRCWDESYYAFRGQVGTSLVCIQGDWSNIVDARIKSRIAALAIGEAGAEHPYNPLYARADRTPKPWGMSGIFAEYTGQNAALEFDWTPSSRTMRLPRQESVSVLESSEPVRVTPVPLDQVAVAAPSLGQLRNAPAPIAALAARERGATTAPRTFSTLWEFAVALNRQDPHALAIAHDGAESQISLDGLEVRKLITRIWFRTAFEHFSARWRERLLEALIEDVAIPNHPVKCRRGVKPLQKVEYAELKELWANTFVPDALRVDLELILTVGRLWGEQALSRLRFTDEGLAEGSASKLGALLREFRS
jgi:cell division GTPase FtsZ